MSKPRESQKAHYRCSRCSETKAEEAFYPSQRKDGAWCRECFRMWHRERAGPAPEPRPCRYCGSEIETPDKHSQKFCSANCKQRARYWSRHPRQSRDCEVCGEDITDRRRDAVVCSTECRGRRRGKRVSPEQRRAWRLWAKYKISPEDYDALEAAQGGRCAICRSEDPKSPHGFWHVDHCHDSGAVRGLLCSGCNTGLGQFGDDPAVLRQAVRYLEGNRKPPAEARG